MMCILLLEIISVMSLIFAVLNILFTFTSLSEMFLLFLYSLIVTTIATYLQKKNKIYGALTVFLFLPLFYFRGKSAFWFLLYLTVITFIYVNKSIGKGNYDHFSRRLRTSFVVIAGITVFVLALNFLRNAIMPGVVFTVIYLLSSIMLVRSLRHIESGMDMKKLNRINLKYLGIIAALSIIMTIDSIRNAVVFIFSKIYEVIIDGLLAILLIPIRFLFMLVENLIEWLAGRELVEVEFGTQEMEFGENGVDYRDLIQSEVVKEIVFSVLSLAVFILIIYIIYKILSKIGNRGHEGLEYQEEREYIKTDKRKKNRFFERYPKELKEQVRYYYRKYLRALTKKKVEIKSSDTSLDIKETSKETFKNEDKIREIYIKARYSNDDIKDEDVGIIKRAYKEK